MCESLEDFVEKQDDDCALSLFGPASAHMMSVNRVTWNEADCSCTINTDDTGDPDPAGDYADVPRNPGTQDWTIDLAGATIPADAEGAPFWNSRGYNRAYFRCWDEELKDQEKRGSDPGTAMEGLDEE